MNQNEFENMVIKSLATHTTKLDNIQMQLKSIDRSLSYNMNRINQLESGVSYMKGMGMFMGTILTIFIALVAYLK